MMIENIANCENDPRPSRDIIEDILDGVSEDINNSGWRGMISILTIL